MEQIVDLHQYQGYSKLFHVEHIKKSYIFA